MPSTDPIHELPIRNREDLQRVVTLVQKRIKTREAQLEQRWENLPEEATKSVIDTLLPVILGNRLAGLAWRLGKRAIFSLMDRLLTIFPAPGQKNRPADN